MMSDLDIEERMAKAEAMTKDILTKLKLCLINALRRMKSMGLEGGFEKFIKEEFEEKPCKI